MHLRNAFARLWPPHVLLHCMDSPAMLFRLVLPE